MTDGDRMSPRLVFAWGMYFGTCLGIILAVLVPHFHLTYK